MKPKLRTISIATVDHNGHTITVVNAYTQFDFSRRGINADYDAIRKCFKEIRTRFSDKRIGYPMIGAGLAGGDWAIISAIIDEALEGCDHTLVRFFG